MTQQKWLRSSEGWIAGVCEGLGKNFGIEPWILRVIWLVSILFFGIGIFLYLGLALTLPREDQISMSESEKLLGVCYRVSQRTNIDVGLVRFICLLLAVSSLGATIIGYFILHFLLPENGNSNLRDVN